MTKKSKIIIGIVIIVLAGLWWFGNKRIPFSMRCLAAEAELHENFHRNELGFFEFAEYVKNVEPIEFWFVSGDTIYLTFQDSLIDHSEIFIDSVYSVRYYPNTQFAVSNNGCLQLRSQDTMEVCNHDWQVQFTGHYQDSRIDSLLSYIGWERAVFNELVLRIKNLNCTGFGMGDGMFKLEFLSVDYYDDGTLHCFGHSDGYFDYLYTTQPDSFYWQGSLDNLHGNYYSVKWWRIL